MNHLSNFIKHLVDFLMLMAAGLGFFFVKVVPALASLAALIWYGFRFYYFFKEKRNGNIRLD